MLDSDSDDLESIDFDLSSDESIDSSSPEEPQTLDVSSDEVIESVEFNTDDINLDDFDFSEEKPALAELGDELAIPEAAIAQTATESGNNDFDFDFDEIPDALASDSDSSHEIDLMVSDLTDMDEFETKIDLAKYQFA